jgi:hypothetical protein
MLMGVSFGLVLCIQLACSAGIACATRYTNNSKMNRQPVLVMARGGVNIVDA